MTDLDTLLDDPFHGAAVIAYVWVIAETGEFPPDSERVRRKAGEIYEGNERE